MVDHTGELATGRGLTLGRTGSGGSERKLQMTLTPARLALALRAAAEHFENPTLEQLLVAIAHYLEHPDKAIERLAAPTDKLALDVYLE
jgi:hypothetical protein